VGYNEILFIPSKHTTIPHTTEIYQRPKIIVDQHVLNKRNSNVHDIWTISVLVYSGNNQYLYN
jgi:hypothetical protein